MKEQLERRYGRERRNTGISPIEQKQGELEGREERRGDAVWERKRGGGGRKEGGGVEAETREA